MATKIKTPTLALVPQSRDDCAAAIATLGDLQREHKRQEAAMNDQINTITQAFQPLLGEQRQRMKALQKGIQAWCEANRTSLCGDGARPAKTANLVTGNVAWRQRPPSVTIKGVDVVLETLQRLGLTRFIRVKNEPNKEAMLAEPEAVRGIAGISIVTGQEDFIVTPLEVTAEEV